MEEKSQENKEEKEKDKRQISIRETLRGDFGENHD